MRELRPSTLKVRNERTPFPFFSLLAELRCVIYRYHAVSATIDITPSYNNKANHYPRHSVTPLHILKRIHQEALPTFYALSHCTMDILLEVFLNSCISPEELAPYPKLVNHVELHIHWTKKICLINQTLLRTQNTHATGHALTADPYSQHGINLGLICNLLISNFTSSKSLHIVWPISRTLEIQTSLNDLVRPETTERAHRRPVIGPQKRCHAATRRLKIPIFGEKVEITMQEGGAFSSKELIELQADAVFAGVDECGLMYTMLQLQIGSAFEKVP